MASDKRTIIVSLEGLKEEIESGFEQGVFRTNNRKRASDLLDLILRQIQTEEAYDFIVNNLRELNQSLIPAVDGNPQANEIKARVQSLQDQIGIKKPVGSIFKRAFRGLGEAFSPLFGKR